LSSFYKWLEEEDYLIKSPMKRIHRIKSPVIIKPAFTEEQIEVIRKSAVDNLRNLTIVDFDDVDITNINRQIPALHSTVGKLKVEVMKDRILDINPDINIKAICEKYNKETSDKILVEDYDYVVDAIDMVTSKIHLIETCNKKGLEIISSMGMGNKVDPTKIVVTDIYKTSMCPLAKVMRKELKDRRIKKLKVVYSTEQPRELKKKIMNGKKVTPGSISFVPSVGGLTIASVVVNDLLNK
jgi:tRNA A37 threonylcarbamoyladenosine dehydratase